MHGLPCLEHESSLSITSDPSRADELRVWSYFDVGCFPTPTRKCEAKTFSFISKTCDYAATIFHVEPQSRRS